MFAASVIITCKGRLAQLQETLPHHFAQQSRRLYEIIVIDYGCPDDAFDWVRAQQTTVKGPRLVACRVDDDTNFFNLSRARNFGARVSDAPVLVFCDADVYPVGPWLDTLVEAIEAGPYLMVRPQWKRGGCGICAVKAETFDQIRGFDEAMKGWGYEDIDFRQRVETVGPVGFYPATLLGVLKHSRAMSVQFYQDQRVKGGIPVSNYTNKRIAQERCSLVNPGGYAQGKYRTARCPVVCPP